MADDQTKRARRRIAGGPAPAPRALPAVTEPTPPAETTPATAGEDVLFVHSRVDESGAYRVLRKREDRIEVAQIQSMQEGQPIMGEVVKLHPREGADRLFDVEVVMEAPAAQAARGRPAQVASAAYRHHYDRIFGRRPALGKTEPSSKPN